MDDQTMTYQEALSRLGQSVLVMRAVLDRTEGRLLIRKFIADRTPLVEPAPRYWDYGHAVFIESVIQADQLKDLIERRQGSLAGRAVFCPEVHQRRLPSRSAWDPDPLPWPQARCEIQAPNAALGPEPSGFLIGQSAEPSYADWATATLDFLFRSDRKPTPQSIPSAFGVLRVADTRAWIRQINVGAASIQVALAGDPSDARLEVNDPQRKASRRVTGKKRTYRFGYEGGVPDGLWIVVSRAGEWLDYRRIDRPQLEHFDSSLDPEEPELMVSSLTAQGEGPHLEFKREVPSGGRDARWLRTASAFANGDGGVILFGIAERSSDREGEVTGLAGVVHEIKDNLDRMIRDNLEPTPTYQITDASLDAGTVVVLTIKPGTRPPYAVHPAKPEYYVRRGASTFPARVEELRQLAAGSQPASPTGWLPGLNS